MSHRIKAVLKAKGDQTQYYGVPNNPLGECIDLCYSDYCSKMLNVKCSTKEKRENKYLCVL